MREALPGDAMLTSSLLSAHGFRHAFFTRRGGVSTGAYESLNFSVSAGDDAANVAENLRRAREALGVAELLFLSQVHGVGVVEATATDSQRDFVEREGDAVWSAAPGVAAGVRVADCVPILVGATRSGAALAIHAGWRGAVAGVVAAGVSALRARVGDEPLVAAVGPHISQAAFELGDEVAAEIERASRVPVIDRSRAKPHADLRTMVTAQLDDLGVTAIDQVEGCTHGDASRFFSFRRDGKHSGRHVAAIAVRV